MIAAYDCDNAAWQELLQDAHPLVVSDALRFMLDTYTTRAGKDAGDKLVKDTPSEKVLRVIADAAVAVFSAEVDRGGDDPRQVMEDAALRIARQRQDLPPRFASSSRSHSRPGSGYAGFRASLIDLRPIRHQRQYII
jgi:hypothetical protein